MNGEFEVVDSNVGMDGRKFLSEAAESFLANLPILVCGMTVGLTIILDLFVG